MNKTRRLQAKAPKSVNPLKSILIRALTCGKWLGTAELNSNEPFIFVFLDIDDSFLFLYLLTFLNSNEPFIFIFLEIDNSFLFLFLLTFCSKSVFLNIVFFHQFVTKIGMNKIRPLKSIKICQIKVNIIKLCFSACLLRLII